MRPRSALQVADHLAGLHPLVELLLGHVAERERGGLERRAFLVRLLGDLRGLVVADVRIERRHQHQRLVEQRVDAVAIRLDAHRAMIVEAERAVGEQADRLQYVVRDHRAEHVQFEVAARAADVHGHVVAEHLAAEHRQRFGLRGVHLARHDRAARLVLGNRQFAETAARAAREPANVVGDLHEARGHGLERAVREHERVGGGHHLELVGRRDEGHARELRDGFGHLVRELRMRVQAGADRRAALREFVEMRQRGFHMLDAVIELRDVARELLAERERRGVLQVRAADLDDVAELLRLGRERVAQRLQRGQQMLDDADGGRDVHGRREHVVGRLAAIDVVVRMHLARFAALAAENLARAVRDHLVEVHVGLRARAGLPDGERELARMLAFDDLVGGLHDRARLGLVEHAEAVIHFGGRALDRRERGDQFRRLLLGRDAEVLQRALRLRAPQLRGGHGDFAERVALHADVVLRCGHG
ncbi:conserved hypothetical protein [Paraburkholderia tropica]